MAERIKVLICGALGKMGRTTVQAVIEDPDFELVGIVDSNWKDETLSEIIGGNDDLEHSVIFESNLEEIFGRVDAQVMIDFTNPIAVFDNTRLALKNHLHCIIGTTGLNEGELKQLEKIAIDNELGLAVIPNFAIGAVLMMKFAQLAAKYFPDVEIIELHHDKKLDAPSGTAIKTAQLIRQNQSIIPIKGKGEMEKISGCRGGEVEQIKIHSVRLPGFIAHQEVIFGGAGQSLTIRHDSYDRFSFMPGVLMVAKKIVNIKGLVYGMDNLI